MPSLTYAWTSPLPAATQAFTLRGDERLVCEEMEELQFLACLVEEASHDSPQGIEARETKK